jgi:hypothetical protein
MLPNEASRPLGDWRYLSDTESSYYHSEFKELLHVNKFKGRVWGLFGTAACRPIVPLPQ